MRQNEAGFLGSFFGIIAVIAVTIFVIVFFVTNYNNWLDSTRTNVTITVTDKQRAYNNDQNEDQYLIFTDGEVFQNTDEYHYGKYNSSDVYGQLKIGKKYDCDVVGKRDPYWSRYRNILSCDEVK